MKTIDTELRAANTQNYNGILTDPIDKHSKSVLAKNPNPITSLKQGNIQNISKMIEQK